MSVEFEFTVEDFVAFNIHHQTHSPTIRRQYYRALLVPPAIWLLFCGAIWASSVRNNGNPWETLVAVSPLLLGIPGYLLLFPWLYRRKRERTITDMIQEGKNTDLFGWTRVKIDPEGVQAVGQNSRTASSWKTVEKIVTTGDYVFIYVNALMAVVVPRRAFTEPGEFDDFAQQAGKYHTGSGGHPLRSTTASS